MSKLPASWLTRPLGDLLLELRNGVFVSRPGIENTGRPILRISSVRPMLLRADDVRYIPTSAVVRNESQAFLDKDDLLFTRYSGNSEYVGACACVRQELGNTLYPDKLIRGRIVPGLVDPRYVEAVMSSPQARAVIGELIKTTAGQIGISGSDLLSVPVPLPPMAEQKRIVAAIEQQFSRLDAGVTALERVRQNLQRLRGAALHRVIDFGLDTDLPTGWEWTTIRGVAGHHSTPVLTGPFGTSLSRSDFQADGIPVLTIGCLTSGGIRTELAPCVTEEKAKTLHRYALEPGDVLFSRMATVGRAAAVTEKEAGSLINYHLMRLRLDQTVILPEFLVLLCRGSRAIGQYLTKSNHGVTRPGINTKQLLGLPVTLPPLSEQEDVVNAVHYADDMAFQLDRGVALATARARRLRSSVLAAAFSGRLVSQDPADEPASVLFERIEKPSLNSQKTVRSRKLRALR